MLDSHNSNKQFTIMSNKKQKVAPFKYKFFAIPEYILPRIPRHWQSFIEDVHTEILTVTNTVYEG